MLSSDHIVQLLEHHGVSPTANRILVLSEMARVDRAVSLRDVEDRLPTLDKSSIFRVLTLLEEHDLVHAFQDGRGVMHYELCRHEHDDHTHGHAHFYCERCRRTYCLEDLPTQEVHLPEGYSARSISFVIKGLCPHCQVH